MAATVKLSQQPRTQSCVVPGMGLLVAEINDEEIFTS